MLLLALFVCFVILAIGIVVAEACEPAQSYLDVLGEIYEDR